MKLTWYMLNVFVLCMLINNSNDYIVKDIKLIEMPLVNISTGNDEQSLMGSVNLNYIEMDITKLHGHKFVQCNYNVTDIRNIFY